MTLSHIVLRINGIKTWVSCILPKDLPIGGDQATVVVVVPGNPGPIGFYDEFISQLHEVGNGLMSIYGVSHAGHHLLPVGGSLGCEESGSMNEWFDYFNTSSADEIHAYSLDEQVAHKLSFIQEYLPVDAKLILIGHSIGAYILLEMINRLEYSNRIVKGILLFPTIERITKTAQGLFWSTLSGLVKWPILTMTVGFNLLPYSCQRYIVSAVSFWYNFNQTENISTAILSFLNYRGVSNLLRIGSDMRHINDVNAHVIHKHSDRLTFYYGEDDPWTPKDFSKEMIKRFPECDIRVCTRQYRHAFVLWNPREMADLVWGWVQPVFSGAMTRCGNIGGKYYALETGHVMDTSEEEVYYDARTGLTPRGAVEKQHSHKHSQQS